MATLLETSQGRTETPVEVSQPDHDNNNDDHTNNDPMDYLDPELEQLHRVLGPSSDCHMSPASQFTSHCIVRMCVCTHCDAEQHAHLVSEASSTLLLTEPSASHH